MPWLGAPPADVALATSDLGDDIVTESKMANDAIGLAELKAGTDGELITWDASGNPVAVAVGTSGHFLKSTGAGSVPVFAAASDILQTVFQQGDASGNETITGLHGPGHVETSLQASITPSSASNKIRILCSFHVEAARTSGTISTRYTDFAIIRNTTAGEGNAHNGTNLLTASANSLGRNLIGTSAAAAKSHMRATFLAQDAPSTTSATTYTLGFYAGESGTVVYYINATVHESSMMLQEIAV